MRTKRAIATLAVSATLMTSAGLAAAPAVAAPAPVAPVANSESGTPFLGSAWIAGQAVHFVICLLSGEYVGSRYPLC